MVDEDFIYNLVQGYVDEGIAERVDSTSFTSVDGEEHVALEASEDGVVVVVNGDEVGDFDVEDENESLELAKTVVDALNS